MKSKVNAVQAHSFNNYYAIQVYRNNGTCRTYKAPYEEEDKAFKLAENFSILNAKLCFALVKERVRWHKRLRGT